MARKVFISILGTSFYSSCKYVDRSIEFESSETRFIQQATLEYIEASKWSEGDAAYFLLTDLARTSNWNESIIQRENIFTKENIPYRGLQAILKEMHLPFAPENIPIPKGENEKEMWEIFNKLFDALQEEDELYFDLTHSFRYLPMLVLVLGNYAKFLKHATVKHISYGNYEARDKMTNRAPIINLLPLSVLQDWTFAAGQFLDSGNVKKLANLSNETLKPILKEAKGTNEEAKNLKKFINDLSSVIDERTLCRGISIVKSDSLKELKKDASKIEKSFIEVLNPVFNKIKESTQDFDENVNVQNGFLAAQWCLHNGLYQQAITIFHENIITLLCDEENLNWTNEDERSVVSIAFHVDKNHAETWNLHVKADATEDEINAKIEKVKHVFTNCHFQLLYDTFSQISDIRNDFNHSGMRNNPMSAHKLRKEIEKVMQSVETILKS